MKTAILWHNPSHHNIQPLFWKSHNGQALNHLRRLQNECLCLTTSTFKTTPMMAMEIEASIPPIGLYLEYKLDAEALHLS